MKRMLLLLLVACLLLTGCSSILDREYSTVEAHSKKYWESEAADTLRAETYQDVVNDLLLLIGQHVEDAVLRLYNFEDSTTVSDTLEKAATEVQQETPMGAYAVEYITSESQYQRGYYEATVRISYRRTEEQIQAIVNATSTSALSDLLNDALGNGKMELAVRIGYWGQGEADKVAQIVAEVRNAHGLTETTPWAVSYYPTAADAGLIEFVMGQQTETPQVPETEATNFQEKTNPEG